MIDMEPINTEKLTTKCSLAIRFIDVYTGKAPIPEGFQLVVDHVIQKPIIKPDGFVIYTNLPEGPYICRIRSSYYLPEVVTVHANVKEPMISIALQPNASYPFGNSATYLRLAFRDKTSRPMDGVAVTAVCKSEHDSMAILAQDVKKGDMEVILTHMKGKIYECDIFLLANRGKDTHDDEYCCISKEIDGFRSFMLQQPMQSAYPRGTLFQATVKTHSNGTGEAVIPFRNPPSKSFVVQLTIEWKDLIMVREVDIKEAGTNYISFNDLDLGESLN